MQQGDASNRVVYVSFMALVKFIYSGPIDGRFVHS